MLKHEDILKKMTFSEKITIITNFSKLKQEKIPDEFKYLGQKIATRGLEYDDFILPHIGKIASSFNDDLMYRYSSFLGYVAYKNNYKFLLSPSINVFNRKNLISKEPYLNKKVLNSFIKGLNNNSVIPLINYYDNDTYFKTDDFIHINEYLQCILHLKNNNLPYILFDNKTNKFKTNQINNYISRAGYSRIYMNNVVSNNQPKKNISLSRGMSFDTTFVEDNVNETLDELLDYLLKSDHVKDNDLNFNKLSNELVIESTVLLKNNNNLLPLKNHKRMAIFTEDKGILNNDFSEFEDVIQIDAYNTLPNPSQKNNYDTLVLIVNNSEDVEHMYKDMHHLNNAHARDIDIIVVLTTNDVVDTSFDKYVDVLFKTCTLNRYNINSFIDIILGNKCPCGKLNILYPNDDFTFKGNEMLTEHDMKYPFGFGLNYGKLTYSDFEFDKNKISFTAKNEDKREVSDVIQIYMENQRWLGEKHLIYYKKIRLKQNQGQRVEIVLTEEMFKRFSKDSNTFKVKKGLYKIYINNSLRDNISSFLTLLDVKKDSFNVKTFKNSAYVAVAPRYNAKNKKNQLLLSRIIIYLLLTVAIILIGVFTKVYPFIGLAIVPLAFAAYLFFFKRNKSHVINVNLDKEFNFDDLIEFEEFYEPQYNDDYVYDRAEIFKEERHKQNINIDQENIFYVKSDEDIFVLYNEFYNYLKANGIEIKKSEFKDLFGSMCTSRVIYLDYNNEDLYRKVLKLVNQYSNGVDFDCFNLEESIKTAKEYPNKIVFTSLSKLDYNMKNINNDCKFNTMNFSININNDKVQLTKNIWYIIPFKIMNIRLFDFNAIVTHVSFKEVPKTKFENEKRQVYFETFEKTIEEIEDKYQVDESIYKKFDDLESYMKSTASYKFYNKLVTDCERFVALNLLFDNNIYTTIDNLFSFKLMWYILRHNVVHLDGQLSKEYLLSKLEEFFGEEYLTNTYKLLNIINLEELKNG